jgi:hypothetical protein
MDNALVVCTVILSISCMIALWIVYLTLKQNEYNKSLIKVFKQPWEQDPEWWKH